jgi:hypothetical protein
MGHAPDADFRDVFFALSLISIGPSVISLSVFHYGLSAADVP